MNDKPIVFDDGASYERMMGVWSRGVGEIFIDWLKPAPGQRWIDVGCGNGAFSQLAFDRCAPARLDGVDPSEEQLDFARKRLTGKPAHFLRGDAMTLPLPDGQGDLAVMALVIFFVPVPVRGVAELARVTRPGGVIAAYAWDVPGGGFPMAPIHDEMRARGMKIILPPSAEASRLEAMRDLWNGAGLEDVETKVFQARRLFPSYDEFWDTSVLSASMNATLLSFPADLRADLKAAVRARVKIDSSGRVEATAHANAVRGRKPG